MKDKVVILYLVVSCISHTAISQPVYPKPFTTINVADGLPQSYVSALIQDSTGFIWMGTRDGLARYDGKKFKIFRHIPGDSTSLSDNIISSLYFDSKLRLWIFYEAGDVDILNTVTESLFHFTKDTLYNSLFALVKTGNSFAEDKQGNSWIINSGSSGIYICNIAKHTLDFYTAKTLGLSNDKIACINSYHGDIILTTNSGLVTFNSNRIKLKTAAYTFTTNMNDLVFTWKTIPAIFRPNGELVMVSRDKLVIYSSRYNSVITLPLPLQIEPTNFCITEDNKGQVYFDYGFDVYVLSPQNKLAVWKPKKENPDYGFKSMLIDRSGVFWLGGNGSGIQLYDTRLPRLSGLPYKKRFHQDVLLDFLHVPQQELDKTTLGASQSYYTRWTKGLHNDIWFTRAGEGIMTKVEMYHYANGHLEIPDWHYTDTIASHHIKINGLAVSPSGELWGIDFNMRPVYFDTFTHVVTVYPSLDSINSDYSFTVSSLYIDKDEKFWISTALNGLFLYDKQHNKVVHYIAGEAQGSLPTNQLMNIVQDAKSRNILWIGSLGGGLIKFDKSTGRCSIYTTKQGLPNNTVYAVLADARGTLWCSSNKGIFWFNPETNEIRNYTSKDGLPGDEFNRYHFLQFPDGRIAFGGVDGYTVFNPLTLSKDNFHPRVALTGIEINNVYSDFGNAGSPFKQAINSLDRIVLNYQQNFLTFQFAALEYNITDKLQYRYMLKGYDKDWVYAGNSNEAVYTKLPPGNYTLKVNATNTAGEWSNYIKTLPVIIKPPFWQTWWFITLMILIAVAAIYFLIRSRMRYIRKQERQKIKYEREASDLRAQALRAQMNPHFIFNCLNSIKALIQEDKKKEAVIYLTTFSKLIRTQLNNAQQEVSLHEELETCRLYTQLEALRFGARIECIFNVDENIDTISLKVPPLILQPFIENAIWHGILPKKSGKVSVTVKRENNMVECTIDDDGIGREMAMRNKSQTSSTYESKGMSLVKHRLGLYNTVNPNGGSVEVIDKKDDAGNAGGTSVILKFKQEL